MAKLNVTIAVDCTPIKGGYFARWKVTHNPLDTAPKRYPWNYITELHPDYRGKLKKFKSKSMAEKTALSLAPKFAEYGYDTLHPALTHED